MSRFDVSAVGAGVIVALGLIVPVAVVARLVSGGELSAGWDTAFTVYIFGATIVGAAVTGRRRPEMAMTHGAVTGALVFIGARIVSAIASGQVPNPIGIVLALVVFAAVGAIGGFVSTLLVHDSSGERRA